MPIVQKKIQFKYMVQEPYRNWAFWLYTESEYIGTAYLQWRTFWTNTPASSWLWSRLQFTIRRIQYNSTIYPRKWARSWRKLSGFRYGKSQSLGYQGKHTRDWTTNTDETSNCQPGTKRCCTAQTVWRWDVVTVQKQYWRWPDPVVYWGEGTKGPQW